MDRPGPRPSRHPGHPQQSRPTRQPDPLWRTVVGTVLRAERRLQGLTLREVATVAGISVPYLSEIERGRKEASSEMLGAAAKALGLRLVDLLARAHDALTAHDGLAARDSRLEEHVLTAIGIGSASEAAPAPVGPGPGATCSLRLVA